MGKHGRKLWSTIRAEYTHLGRSDAAMLLAYCAAFDTHEEMTEVIAREGYFVQAAQGLKAHPAQQIRTRAANVMVHLSVKLGIAHSTRVKVERKADKPQPKSKASPVAGIRLAT